MPPILSQRKLALSRPAAIRHTPRLIPVPGKKAGDKAVFGGLFGESVILPVRQAGASAAFVRHGGRIPAPLHSLNN